MKYLIRHFGLGIAIIFGAFFLSALGGCGKSVEPAAIVSIQKTLPSGDVPLLSNDTVTFQVEVHVQGLKAPGQIALIIQAADGTVLGGCDPISIQDNATATLTSRVLIPDTSVVRIFTPLYFGESSKTEVLDTRIFKVVGKRSS
jgi:hypothetical protein